VSAHISDHVAKFHGDRPVHLGGITERKKTAVKHEGHSSGAKVNQAALIR